MVENYWICLLDGERSSNKMPFDLLRIRSLKNFTIEYHFLTSIVAQQTTSEFKMVPKKY